MYSSKSNFVFFTVPSSIDPLDFRDYLITRNIFLKGPFDKYPFNQQLRITVGVKSQMNFFCDVVDKYLDI